MRNTNRTQEKILTAALELFSTQGIKKTAVEDIAVRAGFTRNTVYTYFKNKRLLVKAAYIQIVAVFQDVQAEMQSGKLKGFEAALDRIDKGLAALPRGNYVAQWEELKRLYPDLYLDMQRTRMNALKAVFAGLSGTKEGKESLRPELNPEVVRLFFIEAVINLVENPHLAALNLTPHEIYTNAREIFLYGILGKEQ